MRVLVTGASGLLGAHLMAGISTAERIVGVDRQPWWGDREAEVIQGDLAAAEFVRAVMRDAVPDVVVHCAAMVNVDQCEREPEQAYLRNAELTGLMAGSAPPQSLFVYLTTDGIFRGDRPFADEEEVPSPLTVYGRSKLRGEEIVRATSPNHLIIRTNFFGWSSGRKRSSAEWLYDTLTSGAPMTAFDDFYFTPMYVCFLVDRLERLIRSPHRGTFHVCGRERVSKYEFAMAMAARASLSTAGIRRGSVEEAGLVARRPKDMSLDSTKAARATGVEMPDCQTSLDAFLAHRGVPLSCRFPGMRGRR